MIFLLLLIIVNFLGYSEEKHLRFQDFNELYKSLEIVKKVDRELYEDLPLIYNQALIAGYISMPSARMAPSGELALGFSRTYPYHIYSLNFQMFKTIELVGNYRVYKGITETGFGHLGYGDDTDRTASIKWDIYQQSDDFPYIPTLAIGFEDFYGSKRFYSFYACATEKILKANLELTLGYGIGRMKGFYGAAAWTPFRKSDYTPLKKFSFIVEYDAYDYHNHSSEHPLGKEVKSHINVGGCLDLFDFLQVKASCIRGNSFAASASIYYNLGSSKGFLPKTQNPKFYTAPINTEEIGERRSEKEFAVELAFACQKENLNLSTIFLEISKKGQKRLYVKIINTIYRYETELRERVQYLLSTLIPSDIVSTVVIVESDGVPIQAYLFRTVDLNKFRDKMIGEHELKILSPLIEVPSIDKKKANLIYNRKKEIWTLTLRPRLITFFGSTTGKIKYNTAIVAGPEGYLFDSVYYKAQLAYNIAASTANLSAIDVYNISHLPIVRSDTVLYFQGDRFALEQAYLQKGFCLGGGWFVRAAAGYFEPAYAGAALEALFYPINSAWAVGFECAGVLKRKYHGIGLRTTTVKINEQNRAHLIHFIGLQYFLDIHYEYRPWHLDFKVQIGQFLAKDKGARFEIGKTYRSGLKFSIWYTLTNGKDIVNYKTYYDKGIAFSIPFDLFLRKSSRTMLGYAMSAWLRDVGAEAMTGKKLFPVINLERSGY